MYKALIVTLLFSVSAMADDCRYFLNIESSTIEKNWDWLNTENEILVYASANGRPVGALYQMYSVDMKVEKRITTENLYPSDRHFIALDEHGSFTMAVQLVESDSMSSGTGTPRKPETIQDMSDNGWIKNLSFEPGNELIRTRNEYNINDFDFTAEGISRIIVVGQDSQVNLVVERFCR